MSLESRSDNREQQAESRETEARPETAETQLDQISAEAQQEQATEIASLESGNAEIVKLEGVEKNDIDQLNQASAEVRKASTELLDALAGPTGGAAEQLPASETNPLAGPTGGR